MRPGRLGAQKETQELRSSGTRRLASFLLHRPERGRPATREPSPPSLLHAPWLSLRLLLGARRTLQEVDVGLRFSFCFFLFVCFFYLSTRPG